jgi:hypothetical protein
VNGDGEKMQKKQKKSFVRSSVDKGKAKSTYKVVFEGE